MNEFEQLLEEHGLTQAALHRQYGIPLRTMGHWKNGDSTCPAWVMNLLRIVVQHDGIAGGTHWTGKRNKGQNIPNEMKRRYIYELK